MPAFTRSARSLCTLFALAGAVTVASAQQAAKQASDAHWVVTWGTAQQLIRPAPATGARGQAVGAQPPVTQPPVTQPPGTLTPAPIAQPAAGQPPSAAPAPPAVGSAPVFRVPTLNNQTIRMIARTSVGGRRARVKLSNAFGSAAVKVGAAHLAVRGAGSSIVAGSDRVLMFAGRRAFTMAPGTVLVSDPVDLDVPALTDLAVSLYFPGDTGQPTTHSTGLRTTYVSTDGDFTGPGEFPVAGTTLSYYWLSGVDVLAPADTAAIVTFGDSITDGARSTADTGNTWPALLAVRLAAKKETARFAVVNQGIGGNRVLTDGGGVSALARLDRDVLGQPGVKWLMVLEGINDIGTIAQAAPGEAVTAEDIIWGLRQIVERARAHGIKVVGCTLTPYEGANYFRENGEIARDAVNRWIRTSGTFDAVVDFDAATRDANNPRRLRPEFDPGDHLHPNDAGYKAMADAIDLEIFKH